MNINNYVFRFLPNILYCREDNYVKQQWFCYKWVTRHLCWSENKSEYIDVDNPNIVPNETIFMYWKQGWENAPSLVKSCLRSVRMNNNGHPMVLLDENNIHEYLNLPEHIEEYHQKGQIKEALYSDMLRICLLSKYGGYWLDATCFLSEPIPAIIEDCDFFMFSRVLLPEWTSPIKGSSWFIRGKKNSHILNMVRNFMFNYWKNKSFLIN